jgi:transforming growth factor-beta-induced protein
MKTLKLNTRILTLATILSFAIFAVSCTKDETVSPATASDTEALKNGNRAPAPGDDPIAQIAIDEGFTQLEAALTYVDDELGAGLVDLFMNGTDQYTVFAPTDDAFEALYGAYGVDNINDLGTELGGAETILNVLFYHVTEGRRAANSVVPKNGMRTIETLLEGSTFSVESGETYPEITAVGNSANIISPNISASNGIIHVIDAVILPL